MIQGTDELLALGKHDKANALIDARLLSTFQTEGAINSLYADPKECIEFPYPSVHKIVQKVAPGRLVFAMANTGQGKTTLFLDCLNHWAERGVQVDYVGTEQEPEELRTKWSCLRTDVPAGVAINRKWGEYDLGDVWREKVEEDMAKVDEAYGQQVKFHPEKFVTLASVEKAAADAELRGAKILMVDHIDRIETGNEQGDYVAMRNLVRRMKEIARDCDLIMLVASQVNRKGREGDRLAAYRPPQLHHMKGAGTKEEEADVVIGMWRPIRLRKGVEGPKEYASLLAAAAKGDVSPLEVLEKDTMAIVCLKHRTENHEGMRCKLSLYHGRLGEAPVL